MTRCHKCYRCGKTEYVVLSTYINRNRLAPDRDRLVDRYLCKSCRDIFADDIVSDGEIWEMGK